MLKFNIKKFDYHKLYYSHDATRVGVFDMPKLRVTYAIPRNVISFNERKSISNPSDRWVDFFIDDYKFAIMEKMIYIPKNVNNSTIKSNILLDEVYRLYEGYMLNKVYKQLDRLIKDLKRFEGIITPDFSLFPEMPKSQRIWNCYQSRVIAYYMQQLGLNIIPSVAWALEEDLSWCFDGLPINSSIAISTNGCKTGPYSKRIFLLGVEELQRIIKPKHLIICGSIFKELEKYDNIIRYNSFSQRLAIKLKNKIIQNVQQYEFAFEFS